VRTTPYEAFEQAIEPLRAAAGEIDRQTLAETAGPGEYTGARQESSLWGARIEAGRRCNPVQGAAASLAFTATLAL
jgi:hypothetical protein